MTAINIKGLLSTNTSELFREWSKGESSTIENPFGFGFAPLMKQELALNKTY